MAVFDFFHRVKRGKWEPKYERIRVSDERPERAIAKLSKIIEEKYQADFRIEMRRER